MGRRAAAESGCRAKRCIQPVMICSERERLQELAVSIHKELIQHTICDDHPDLANGNMSDPTERAIRTALFSSQIDLAFHRAKCVACRVMDEVGGEASGGSLARAA